MEDALKAAVISFYKSLDVIPIWLGNNINVKTIAF